MGSDRYKVDKILTLECDGEKFFVLKSIICKHSPVLSKACNGQFKEASTDVIAVTNFDGETLRRMLDFMYEGRYDVSRPQKHEESKYESYSEPDGSPQETTLEDKAAAVKICKVSTIEDDEPSTMLDMLRPHILVNSIADYYDILGLKQLANGHIKYILENSWSANGLAAAMELAFESTSDMELSTIMAAAVSSHIKELIDREDFIQNKLLNEFSLGIIQSLFKKMMASEHKVKDFGMEIRNLTDKREDQEYSHKREVSRLEETIKKMENAIDITNERQYCRHCDKAWSSHIESGPSYKVRCAACRTRHHF